MKQIVGIFALVLAPSIFGGPRQEPPADPLPLASSHDAGSTSSKATSHDRHMRKHRASSHHHRRHTTAKNHTS
jgi:hypothetical protein